MMNKKKTQSRSIQKKVLEILVELTEGSEVKRNIDISLFDRDMIDSLGFVQLIVLLSDAFQIEIPPLEVERDQWATPRKIIENIQNRMHQPLTV